MPLPSVPHLLICIYSALSSSTASPNPVASFCFQAPSEAEAVALCAALMGAGKVYVVGTEDTPLPLMPHMAVYMNKCLVL